MIVTVNTPGFDNDLRVVAIPKAGPMCTISAPQMRALGVEWEGNDCCWFHKSELTVVHPTRFRFTEAAKDYIPTLDTTKVVSAVRLVRLTFPNRVCYEVTKSQLLAAGVPRKELDMYVQGSGRFLVNMMLTLPVKYNGQ